ncbi:DUF3298 and DUF4163 domain-containing protein [Owenweeksia hongkongensis]|uniref:DUF3298 and DUF4163 domain-containing protein n=1 Tax=Owenweeksia hongkongensis TaxID=253245 RepID=UPI003A8CD26C
MTLKNYSAAAIIFATSFACQNDPATPEVVKEEAAPVADTLQYEIITVASNLPCAKDSAKNCVEVKIDELYINGGTNKASASKIEATLRKALSETDNSEGAPRKPQDIIANLEKEYTQITKDMKNYDLSWEYIHNMEVYLNGNNLFGCSIYNYTFTGGAHPNGFKFYYTFAADKGTPVKLTDLILPNKFAEFKALAEKQFRETREIEEGQTFEEAGYWFENDAFALNNNFKYDVSGLTIMYNQYEIAPYSEGSITLEFPYSQIKGMVKAEYRF